MEHWNEEAGAVWLKRMTDTYEKAVWLNPTAERYWDYAQSTLMIRELMGERMYPLTIDDLDRAMREVEALKILRPALAGLGEDLFNPSRTAAA